jgi:hypothetical protein
VNVTKHTALKHHVNVWSTQVVFQCVKFILTLILVESAVHCIANISSLDRYFT